MGRILDNCFLALGFSITGDGNMLHDYSKDEEGLFSGIVKPDKIIDVAGISGFIINSTRKGKLYYLSRGNKNLITLGEGDYRTQILLHGDERVQMRTHNSESDATDIYCDVDAKGFTFKVSGNGNMAKFSFRKDGESINTCYYECDKNGESLGMAFTTEDGVDSRIRFFGTKCEDTEIKVSGADETESELTDFLTFSRIKDFISDTRRNLSECNGNSLDIIYMQSAMRYMLENYNGFSTPTNYYYNGLNSGSFSDDCLFRNYARRRVFSGPSDDRSQMFAGKYPVLY